MWECCGFSKWRTMGELKYHKVHGEHNTGDMMTKYVNKTITDRLVGFMGQQFRDGRATTSLRIQ